MCCWFPWLCCCTLEGARHPWFCLPWSWLSRCCVWPCVHQHGHTLSVSYFGLHRELLNLGSMAPSTLHMPAAPSKSSLPAGLQPFALCFVFRSALQMLISLLCTSAR